MNQFTSIYSQLFCCSCPGGLANAVRCENRTDVFVTYPLAPENGYAWVAGLLCLALVLVIVLITVAYCCKRKR